MLILETKGQDTEQDRVKRRYLDEWVQAVNQQVASAARAGMSRSSREMCWISWQSTAARTSNTPDCRRTFMTFDAFRWGTRIIGEEMSVQTVMSLFEDRQVSLFEDRQQAMEDAESRRDWSAYCLADRELGALMKGSATFRRQVVVIAVTYVELMTEDFLKCVFTHRPKSMYNYLNQLADQKGKIDLREVLDAESKEVLLENLALRSARIASQGKFLVLARNIESLTRRKFQAGLVDEIESIVERRNRLVHEDTGDAVSSAEAVAALQSTMKLASDLARIALQCGIPATPWDMIGPDGMDIKYSYEINGQLARSHGPLPVGFGGDSLQHYERVVRDEVDSWISSVRSLGIESIICLLDTDELDLYQDLPTTLPDYYQSAGFQVRHIPAKDYQDPPLTAEHLSNIWVAYQALPKPVLVHCRDGYDRTGMAVEYIQEHLSRA